MIPVCPGPTVHKPVGKAEAGEPDRGPHWRGSAPARGKSFLPAPPLPPTSPLPFLFYPEAKGLWGVFFYKANLNLCLWFMASGRKSCLSLLALGILSVDLAFAFPLSSIS